MNVEHVHNGIRYTLSNDNLKVGDEVFPIAWGRRLDETNWILHNIDYRYEASGFPNDPHIIKEIKKIKKIPYEIVTEKGYSHYKCYFKIIKKEIQIIEDEKAYFISYKWIEIE